MIKGKLKDILIVLICLAVCIPILLHIASITNGGGILSVENMFEVGLFFIIGVSLLYLIEYFIKKNQDRK